MSIVHLSRPPKVERAITRLMDLAVELDAKRTTLSELAVDLKELGCDTGPLADASHDLEHSWRHLTSVRRALVMAWPTIEDRE